MSKVFKGVKKVFKKVAKVVKKVAPIVLAIGAIAYTGGAALGLSSMSFGTAVSGMVGSSIAGSSTLASAVAGAITQAGYGAATGALISGVTGGDVMKGAQTGALTGAVTGGITGGMGGNIDPLGDWASKAGGAAASTAPAAMSIPGTAGPMSSTPQLASAGTSAADAASKGTGFLAQGGWLERNQELAGGVVKGVGGALLQGMGDQGAAQAGLDRDREQRAAVAANYGGSGTGLLSSYQAPNITGQQPTINQQFKGFSQPSPSINKAVRYVYDVQQGRIVTVPSAV